VAHRGKKRRNFHSSGGHRTQPHRAACVCVDRQSPHPQRSENFSFAPAQRHAKSRRQKICRSQRRRRSKRSGSAATTSRLGQKNQSWTLGARGVNSRRPTADEQQHTKSTTRQVDGTQRRRDTTEVLFAATLGNLFQHLPRLNTAFFRSCHQQDARLVAIFFYSVAAAI